MSSGIEVARDHPRPIGRLRATLEVAPAKIFSFFFFLFLIFNLNFIVFFIF
jgi:hypothetical protein